MATTAKNTIKDWFKTGLKPTQPQFWAWMESYWHKDEMIPITAIDGIEDLLNEKADAEAFTNHLSDADAHAELFAKAKIYATGEFQIFKRNGNAAITLEANDWAKGIVEGVLIEGIYLGGDLTQLTSFDIINQQNF